MIATYRALLISQFQVNAQYRVAMYLYVLFSFVRPVVFLAAWSAVSIARGGSVGGYAIEDLAAYYLALTVVMHLTMSWNKYEFEFEIRFGRLSPKLMRPLHPLHYSVAGNITWKLFTGLGVVPVLAIVALTFHPRFETQWWHLALFVPSVLVAAALAFFLDWIVATSAFWTTRVHALATVVDRTAFIFAGQIAPLALMPGPLQAIAYVLPFGYILGAPAEILRGAITLDSALPLVAGQVVWLVLAVAAYRVLWRAGLRAFSAVGI